MTTPHISIIIPAHDAAALIGTQLDALAAQVDTDLSDVEVVIADNGSTDDLAGAVAPHAAALDIRIVDASARRGAAYARNVGIGAARGELLLFCDADDAAAPHFLVNGIRTLQDVPVFSGSALAVEHEEFSHGLAGALAPIEDPPGYTPPVDQGSAYPILHGAVFGMRREVAVAIGGFDASLRRGGEDNDLALRLVAAGHPVPVSGCVRVAYRGRRDVGDSLRERFRVGYAHALLCTRFDRWGSTPPTASRNWAVALVRVAVALVLTVLRPGRAPRAEVLDRGAIVLGIAAGRLRFAPPFLRPRRRIGEGLDGGGEMAPARSRAA